MDRLIPIRFVQFTRINDQADALNEAEINEQIEASNSIFKAAGVQFYLKANHVVENDEFALLDNPYDWVNPSPSSTLLVFNPGCSLPVTAEDKTMAMRRAGQYCSWSDEILVYTYERDDYGCVGQYPWESRAIIMRRNDEMRHGWRTFAHELGHFLGLPHVFRGVGGAYDLTNPRSQTPLVQGYTTSLVTANSNLRNPETGGPAVLSDYWDLVYKSKDAYPLESQHRTFSTKADASAYEAVLLPIQDEADGPNAGYVCQSLDINCRRTLFGYYPYQTLKMAVHSDGLSSETWFTGMQGMKGLGYGFAGGVRGFDAMCYSYEGPGWIDPGGATMSFSLSESQVLQIRRTLRFDIGSVRSEWPGTLGRRPQLGQAQFSMPADKLDFDGIGGRDIAVFEPATGQFKTILSGNGAYSTYATVTMPRAGGGDIPVPADYDADGKTDYAVFHFGTTSDARAYWRWCPSRVAANQGGVPCNRIETVQFGDRGDVPLPAQNFDGNSSTPELAIYRASLGRFVWGKIPIPPTNAPGDGGAVDHAVSAYDQMYRDGIGTVSSHPLPGLYDGDSQTDLAVFNPSSTSPNFVMRLSTLSYNTSYVRTFPAPTGNARPVPIRQMSNSGGRPALALWYPGQNWRILWNPASLPQNWDWAVPGGAERTDCPWGGAASQPLGGKFDKLSDGRSDMVIWGSSGDGTYGIFYTKATTTTGCGGAEYNFGVSKPRPLHLAPAVVADMFGDGRQELLVIDTETMEFVYYPSDSPYNYYYPVAFQLGSPDAKPL